MEDPGAHAARVSHPGSRGVGKYRKIWKIRNIWEDMGNLENNGKYTKLKKYQVKWENIGNSENMRN